MGYNNSDLIFSNIAKGKYTFKEILEKYDVYIDEDHLEEDNDADTLTQKFLRRARGIAKGVRVGGIENTMISESTINYVRDTKRFQNMESFMLAKKSPYFVSNFISEWNCVC